MQDKVGEDNPENQRDSYGRFKKGHSGNPVGKPKGKKDWHTISREKLSSEAPKQLKQKFIQAGLVGEDASVEDVLFASALLHALNGNTRSLELILNYQYGKPEQKIQQLIGIADPEKRKALEDKLKLMSDEVNNDKTK